MGGSSSRKDGLHERRKCFLLLAIGDGFSQSRNKNESQALVRFSSTES